MAQENIFRTNSDVILGFGVELEMGIEPNIDVLRILKSDSNFDDSDDGHQLGRGQRLSFPGQRDLNREIIHRFLVGKLKDAKFTAVSGDIYQRAYDKWQIDDEPAITEDGKTCSVLSRFKIVTPLTELFRIDRVEVVSPILGLPSDNSDVNPWTQTLENLFTCIEKFFHIIDLENTSTHIHIAPMGQSWSRAEIVSIGEGINLISDILPVLPRFTNTERTKNWARRNPHGAFNRNSTILSVVQSLCPDRDVAWNLRPMVNDPEKPAKVLHHHCVVPGCSFPEKDELVATIGSDAAANSDRKLLLLYNLLDRTASRFGLEGTI